MQDLSAKAVNPYPKFLRLKLFSAIAIVVCLLYACKKDPDPISENACATTPKSFSGDANTVIQASCAVAGCHGSGSQNGPGELLTYAQIFSARSGIRSAVSSGRMPKGRTLTAAEKNAIICWIDNGAPND